MHTVATNEASGMGYTGYPLESDRIDEYESEALEDGFSSPLSMRRSPEVTSRSPRSRFSNALVPSSLEATVLREQPK
jgi:hypothetical protein